MILAAHQPNLMPWGAYFQKMRECDLFVIMTNCQYEKGGYQSRFKSGGKWYGLRTVKGLDPINEKRYVDTEADFDKLVKVFPKLEAFKYCLSPMLWVTNSMIIREACGMLNVKTPIAMDHPTKLKGTARLVDLCVHHGATKYLSGISGKKYLDLSLFDKAGIEVIFQEESKLDKRPLHELI